MFNIILSIISSPLFIIIVSLIISAILLAFFAIKFAKFTAEEGEDYKKKIPQLEVKWIVISFIPLILALIISGYLKSFKGFGLEVVIQDTTINKAQQEFGLGLKKVGVIDGIKDVEAIERKQTTESAAREQLDSLEEGSPEKFRTINVLLLKNGVSYEIGALKQYLTRLNKLKFIEIVDKDGKFLFLLPLNEVGFSDESQKRFLEALQTEQINSIYKNDTITETVSLDDSLRKVMNKFTEAGSNYLPVIENDKLKYIINAYSVINTLDTIIKRK